MAIHEILEIVLAASLLVVVISHASAFQSVTGALGNAYGSGVATLIG